MNPNLSTSFLAIQTDRSRLSVLAGRGWQAEQAVHRHSTMKAIGARLGIVLVAVGERLQELPLARPAPGGSGADA